MVVGSLFSGIGLLDYGLTLAGLEHAWFCEANPFRQDILRKRWPGRPVYDDVRQDWTGVERVDVIAGGFPCKGISSAGKRTGFDHPESVLWREMARAIRDLRPRYVLVENVDHILALHDGAIWGEVLRDLAEGGFDVWWDVLPAAAVGAPHLRQRVIAVAAYADGPDAVGDAGERGFSNGWPDVGGGDHAAADTERGSLELRGGPGAVGEASDGARGEVREQWVGGAVAGGVEDAADACGCGHGQIGRHICAREPDATGRDEDAADTDGWRGEAGAQQDIGSAGGQPAPYGHDAHGRGIRVEWGEYEPAIRRWETVHGPAPEPLVRGMDDRSARRMERSRLSALGDGVQVQLGLLAGTHLLNLERQRLT